MINNMKKTLLLTLLSGSFLIGCSSSKVKKSAAAQLQTIDIKALDTTISPADDFFLFANGTWIANTQIPASESRWGSFNELEQANNLKLQTILNQEAAKEQANAGSSLLGAYYSSFMDMTRRDQMGLSPLQEDLQAIARITQLSELQQQISRLHQDGLSPFFSFGSGQDLMNVQKNSAYLSQGGLGLPNRGYYFDDNKTSIRDGYLAYMMKCLQLAGIENAEAVANTVLRFETDLAVNQLSPADLRQPEKVYNPCHRREVQKLFGDGFVFENYLQQLGCPMVDTIVVGNKKFVETLGKLMVETDLQTLKHYLTWNLINHYSAHLDQGFLDLHFQFYEGVLSGKQEAQPLYEMAIDEITNSEIGELLGKAFVEKHFSKEAQNRVNTMVDNLLFVYQERIQQLDWMSDATKQEALVKLNSIGRKLGFPSKWTDFSNLSFVSHRYFQNYRALARFSVHKNLIELTQPVDKEKWGMPAHMVNAYYHPLLNEIAFPAGIMQAPFFDEKFEDAVNYGRIGMVIGHEFTHGFDDMGSKFAADGSFTNWWTEEDRMLFEEKTKLLGATFSGFCPMEDHCVNPELTMGENIADLGGLTMAFYAYQRTAEFKANELVAGYTPAQRFFIAYAQLWKIKYTDAEMKKRLATDPHSPGMYRVNGPLKNCPEFFEAFQVPEGREMRNDVKKVARIW